jgi:dTDP-4-dehydrorhamnose reductase
LGTDRSLLVTGAGGQLGKALRGIVPSSVFLDRAELDVTDQVAVQRAIEEARPRVVIHAAAYTSVDAAEEDPAGAEAINIAGTQNIVSASESIDSLVVYPSTDYVFDGTKSLYREEDETRPLSVYGRTKLEGERIVQKSARHLVARTSWVFGDGHNFLRSILKAATAATEVKVVDDQRGLPTYAPDLARGILSLVDHDASGLFHLAGAGEPCTWADLAQFALEIAGLPTEVIRVSTEEYASIRGGRIAPRPPNSVLDCTKAASVSVTLRPWRQAVAQYVEEIV